MISSPPKGENPDTLWFQVIAELKSSANTVTPQTHSCVNALTSVQPCISTSDLTGFIRQLHSVALKQNLHAVGMLVESRNSK